jgi:osmotically-inducible protein OsmY
MRGLGALPGTLAVAVLALAPACRNTAEGAKEDAQQNVETARQDLQAVRDAAPAAAQEAGETAAELGGKVADGARDLSEAFEKGADAVGSDVAAGKQTLDVKAALTLDQSIDATHINVDTDAETRTVTLRGSVPTAAQKAAVEKVARDKAEGYRVVNQLTLQGAS